MTFLKFSQPTLTGAKEQLRFIPLFRGLPEEATSLLLKHACLLHLKKGQPVFQQGDAANHWYLLIQGNVITLRYGHDGEERIFRHIEPGQLLAPLVMFMSHRSYPVGSQVVSDSWLCRLRRESLHEACLQYPQIAIQMLDMAGQVLNSRMDDVDTLSSRNAAQRLSGYLLNLYKRQGQEIELPLTQRQLAATLGIRPETLNRLLAQWQREGYLQGQRRHWLIHDSCALGAISC